MQKFATISECGKYRYSLVRDWSDGAPTKTVAFVGLNPSTADATLDDPTIRRCIGFAKAWGYNQLLMVNLFAFRATEPADMKAAEDPVGPKNLHALSCIDAAADLVVVAWGAHGGFLGQDQVALGYLDNPHHLGLTKDGHPRHPLYLKGDTRPQPLYRSSNVDLNG